jgi:hypothetical protein
MSTTPERLTICLIRKPLKGFQEIVVDPKENPGVLQMKTTGSFVNLKIARLWMRECLATHQQCIATSSIHSPLPNRVLEIGESSSLVLCESKDNMLLT